MKTLEPGIVIVPYASDNYAYLFMDNGKTFVVDPGDAGPVIAIIEKNNTNIDAILITHHHSDHTGGVGEISGKYGSKVIDGSHKNVSSESLQLIEIPGHAKHHLAYYSTMLNAVFTGDTLFACGCGRIFEGTADQMYSSLKKLAALPDETLVYPGHEYTVDNIRFALTVDPENPDLKKRLADAEILIRHSQPTIPSTIALEKKTNPFLRPFSSDIRKSLRMETASDVEVFAELRKRKNKF